MKQWPKTMPSPVSDGQAVLQEKEETMTYRNERYTYIHRNYRDPETGLEFVPNDLDFENLEQVYQQYRERHNIPSPAELRQMRERYGLSASKMSDILGLGVNQYSRYEDGVMPTEAIGKMLRSIETPSVFLGYMRDSKSQFSEKEYERLCAKVQRSFLGFIKSKPDLSWFWDLMSPGAFLNKATL